MKTVRELAYTVRAWLWTIFWMAVMDEILLNGKLLKKVTNAVESRTSKKEEK